jgi:hypothetical protein
MPYIKQSKRSTLDPTIERLHRLLVDLEADDENNNMEGNLNYIITRLLRLVYGTSSTTYRDINDAMGLMFSAALEHYITVARPYEEQKRFENGDINAEKEPVIMDITTIVGQITNESVS